MKDPDAVHGAGRGQRAGQGQRRGRFVGLQLGGHILIVVDDKFRTLLPHPVCINRLSSIAPPRRRTSSRTPRAVTPRRRDLHYRGILSTDRALSFPFTCRHLDEKP